MSIAVDKKSGRGRPVVDTELLTSRVARPVVDALDTWISQQPDPKPSRPEAIRVALKEWLAGLGLLKQQHTT